MIIKKTLDLRLHNFTLIMSISYTIHMLEILNYCLKYGILENKPTGLKCFRYNKMNDNLENVLYLMEGYDHC